MKALVKSVFFLNSLVLRIISQSTVLYVPQACETHQSDFGTSISLIDYGHISSDTVSALRYSITQMHTHNTVLYSFQVL